MYVVCNAMGWEVYMWFQSRVVISKVFRIFLASWIHLEVLYCHNCELKDIIASLQYDSLFEWA